MSLSDIARRAGIRFGLVQPDPEGVNADRLFSEFDARAETARHERQNPSPEAERVAARVLGTHQRRLDTDAVADDLQHFTGNNG